MQRTDWVAPKQARFRFSQASILTWEMISKGVPQPGVGAPRSKYRVEQNTFLTTHSQLQTERSTRLSPGAAGLLTFCSLFFRAGRGFCPPSPRQQITPSVLREKRLEGFQRIPVPSYAEAPPQWCTDHGADAPDHRGPLGVHRVRAGFELEGQRATWEQGLRKAL